ncbi:MAG TPA: hypothetical protein VJ826_08125, partial [Candidatus Polarisedimenticolaceae bacterium]|nr:hypothetical protein [Candidatus Polarisedimenticolaceae bacterium]
MKPAAEFRPAPAGGGALATLLETDCLRGLRTLDLKDLPRWKHALERGKAKGFGCYFPYVAAHNRPERSAVLVGEDAGCLCVFILRDREPGPHLDVFLAPIPMDATVARRCLERANDFNGDRSARILRIDAEDAAVAAEIPGLSVRERRAQYLYAPQAFGDLSGGKFRTLRRHVTRIQRLPDLEVAPYDPRFDGMCRSLLER